ncbi:hypothetical protein [Nocardiopsis suaedae]|uniref:Pyrrolo-quinoline quinone n=1 Tax=Nocardiopsis suaedae TaxID=3018444 RepID=A0ABT4TMG4_9ACTN|nr:hypothetical protein [Nocardiopsis suaedae]MDA2805580.1 hypothetical protein [Nocardiopsis suaedae]
MRTTRWAPRAATAGAVSFTAAVLLGSTACTPDEPDPPDASPQPLPTAFDGERPPGVMGDPVRHMHGPGADGPDILDDDMGVRIQALGDAFLISSNSEERHLLQRASDGTTLWQGGQRVDGLTRTAEGRPALRLTGEGGASVVDDEGETVWEGGGREVYVPGFSVRRPEEWSPDDPYGAFAVSGPGGGEPLWEYTFEAPDGAGDEEDADGAGDGEGDEDTGGDGGDGVAEGDDSAGSSAPDPERMGVPVAADDGVLLLDDGAGLLQARDPEEPDEPLWSVTGDDADLLGDGAVPRPTPRVVGHYPLPAPEEGSAGDASPEDASPGDGASDEGGESPSPDEGTADDGPDAAVRGVLVRWTRPEEPSLLSMHDLHTGEVVWTLQEPGTNPADPDFAPDPLAGAVSDPETGTLLLPQAGGRTPVAALDTATGDLLWEFEGEDERALSVAFAAGGFAYADARGADDTTQVVLEARSKDEAAEGLDSSVEAVSADGYAVVVHDRQRFVFAPADAPDGE